MIIIFENGGAAGGGTTDEAEHHHGIILYGKVKLKRLARLRYPIFDMSLSTTALLLSATMQRI